MKIIFSFITILALSIASTKSSGSENDLSRYFDSKHRAEICLMDSNYVKADSLYKEAFHYNYPFPRDLYNAFVVSCIVLDTAFSESCFNLLIALGYDMNKLEGMEGIQFAKQLNERYYQFLFKDKDYYRFQYLKSGKRNIIAVLDSLWAVDQFYRRYWNTADSCIKYDSLNLVFLKKYIAKNRFPSHQQAGGVDIATDFPSLGGDMFLFHWHQRGKATVLDTLYYNALIAGQYEPNLYALVISLNPFEDNTYQLLCDPWGGEVQYKKFADDFLHYRLDTAKINYNRRRLYLEPFNDYIKKLRYLYNSGDKRFFLVSGEDYAMNEFIFPCIFKKEIK